MICIISLFVFAVLGIFSAKYRTYFREAVRCVFRRATLRKCDTGFDKKMKAKIVGKLMKRHPNAAKSLFRHFEAISWIFTILLISSMLYSAHAIYNYAMFGNCNGKTGGFCVFNSIQNRENISLSEIPLENFPSVGPQNAPVNIVEFGCFQCPYTKAAEPKIKAILDKYPQDVRLTFVYAPTPQHRNAVSAAEAAACAARQGKFSPYRDLLFEHQPSFNNSVSSEDARTVFKALAKEANLDLNAFEKCITSESAFSEVERSADYAKKIGITKTPTFYINGIRLPGVVSERDVEKALSR